MAKKTRTELSTLAINTNLPDNTTELITPTTERAQLTDERESVVNYKDDLGGVPNAGKFLTVATDGESLTMVDEPQGDIQGAGVDGQITYWDGTKTVTSDAMLLIDTTNKRLKIVIPAANTGGGISLNAVNAVGSSSLTFLNNGVTYAQLYYDNSTGNLRLASDGDVEINPSGTLSVDSGATFSGSIITDNEVYLDNGKYLRFERSSGGLSIQTLGIESGTDDVRLLTTGAFKIKDGGLNDMFTISSGGLATFVSTSVTNNAARYNMVIADNSAVAAGNGGGIVFKGVYTGTTDVDAAGITSFKTNGTDGDYGYGLSFVTRENGGNLTSRLTISSGGDVLIGNPTSDTGLKLQVHGADGTSYLKLTSTVATTGGRIGYNGSVLRIDQQENNDITFRTNGSEKMRITSGGDVLIGTTDTAIKGKTTIEYGSNTTTNPTLLLRNGGGSAAFATFSTGTGGTTLFGYIQRSGSGINYASNSDYRLKENVTPITDALSRVNQLKPSRFNFIADADKIVDGFIAHEVEDIVPEAICGEKDAVREDGTPDYQGIDQSKIVPLLTAAIQEQQTIIEDLKARIETLEG